MPSFLIAAALLVAVAAVLLRLLRQRAVERARPGCSPAAPIEVTDYGEIDFVVALQTCRCGGHFVLRGEGPLAGDGRPLRVAHVECRRCEREQRLYFDLSRVLH